MADDEPPVRREGINGWRSRALPKDRLLFATAVLDLVLAAVMFADRNSPNGDTLFRYVWLILLIGAFALFYRAYHTAN